MGKLEKGLQDYLWARLFVTEDKKCQKIVRDLQNQGFVVPIIPTPNRFQPELLYGKQTFTGYDEIQTFIDRGHKAAVQEVKLDRAATFKRQHQLPA